MHKLALAVGISLAVAFAAVEAPALSQTPAHPEFTVEQAKAGEALFTTRCGGCHNADLSAGGHGPSLSGDGFWANWEKRPVRELYSRIISTMPADDPGVLEPPQVLDLISYILLGNGYPAGAGRLTSPDALNQPTLNRQK